MIYVFGEERLENSSCDIVTLRSQNQSFVVAKYLLIYGSTNVHKQYHQYNSTEKRKRHGILYRFCEYPVLKHTDKQP